MGAVILTLIAGYWFKARCSAPEADAYRDLCYNDIQPLYGIRGVESGIFPYIDGELRDGELVQGAIEYPVLTGVFMWFAGRFADDYASYLTATSFLLAPFGLLAAYMLGLLAGKRALLFAAAPAIVLYSFHNWDLLVVAAVAAGIWTWRHEGYGWSAVFFGIGAALKMYPALFLVPLTFDVLKKTDRTRAIKVLGVGAGTFALINLPFVVANFDGWWATYEFHRARVPNYDTIWMLGLHPSATVVPSAATTNLISTALMVLSFAGALFYSRRSTTETDAYLFLQTSGALLAAFLLFNKVHSPQYILWLLPFFVVLRVHIGWWIAYTVADLAVYVGIFRWFYDFGSTNDIEEVTAAKGILIGGIWARTILLACLFVVFLRARVASEPGHSFPSHPRPNVSGIGSPTASER